MDIFAFLHPEDKRSSNKCYSCTCVNMPHHKTFAELVQNGINLLSKGEWRVLDCIESTIRDGNGNCMGIQTLKSKMTMILYEDRIYFSHMQGPGRRKSKWVSNVVCVSRSQDALPELLWTTFLYMPQWNNTKQQYANQYVTYSSW